MTLGRWLTEAVRKLVWLRESCVDWQQRACEQGVASCILDVTSPGCNGKCCSLGEDVVEQWKLGNVVGCAELEIPVLNITVTSPPMPLLQYTSIVKSKCRGT